MTVSSLMVGCNWIYHDMHDYWKTECGNDHAFIEGGPEDNGYRYCPYCGFSLILVRAWLEETKHGKA